MNLFGFKFLILFIIQLIVVLTLKNDYQGLTLTVQVPLSDSRSINHLEDKRQKLIDTAVKLNYPLLESFKLIYNLKIDYKIEFCNNSNVNNNSNSFEVINEDAILEDCVYQALQTTETDISLFPLLLTSKNIKNYNFPAVSWFVHTKFIFLQPKLSLITNVYTLPFTKSVWLACLGLICLVVLFLFVLSAWQKYKMCMNDSKLFVKFTQFDKDGNDKRKFQCDEEVPDSFLEVTFVAVGAVSQQGAEKDPSGLHGKIITWCFFVAFMFLYAAYSANIVALLQATSSEVKDVKDLVRSRLDVGVSDSYFIQRIIQDVKGEDRLTILRKAGLTQTEPVNDINMNRFTDKHLGVKKIHSEMFAFYIESHIGYTFIEEAFDEVEKCDLQEIQFIYFPTDLYFVINKNSSLFEMFKVGFLRLKETGIHNRESLLLQTPKPKCWTLDTQFTSIGIADCYFAMLLIAGGVVVSLLIFCLELISARLFKQYYCKS